MTTISATGVILYWSPLLISLCSICFTPCDLWTTQAHTKTKGTLQQMRYRFFANVCSTAWINAGSDRVVIVLMSIFVLRLLATSECHLHGHHRMKRSIPTVWQVSWLIMTNIAWCWQPDHLKSSKVNKVWCIVATISHLDPLNTHLCWKEATPHLQPLFL